MNSVIKSERISKLQWGPDATTKFHVAAAHLIHGAQSLLDVGCRDGALKAVLPQNMRYVGVDISAGPEVSVVHNVEHGLPFQDQEFDIAAALDVLEHVDKMHFVFRELVRVAKKQILVQLPNMYHWSARLDYLRARYPDKYVLQEALDRHRWMPSHEQSVSFAQSMAAQFNFDLKIIPISLGRRYRIIDKVLSLCSLNLAARSTMMVFTR